MCREFAGSPAVVGAPDTCTEITLNALRFPEGSGEQQFRGHVQREFVLQFGMKNDLERQKLERMQQDNVGAPEQLLKERASNASLSTSDFNFACDIATNCSKVGLNNSNMIGFKYRKVSNYKMQTTILHLYKIHT